jgi:exportin-7
MLLCSKIATNLKVFGSCEGVVEQTLTLFQVGGCAGQHVVRIQAVGTALLAPNTGSSLLPSADCPPGTAFSRLHQPLQDLAAGYMSGKLLLKLDAIAFLLTHHTSGEICFCNRVRGPPGALRRV